MSKNYERMIKGELYIAKDEKLASLNKKKWELVEEFNATPFAEVEHQQNLIRNLFGKVGSNCYVNKPFYCDYGCNIEVGDNFYANADCLFLDVCKIKIGNNVFLGPRVMILTPCHPIDAEVRNSLLEYGKEVVIGDNVWIGGGVIINPGVTIGDNVVIGSGSVVTKSLTSGGVYAGNPCHLIRKITEEDHAYWEKKKQEYYSE